MPTGARNNPIRNAFRQTVGATLGAMLGRRRIRDTLRALDQAACYVDWLAAAEHLDELLGLDAWRAEDDSSHYDARLIRDHLHQLRRARDQDDPVALAELLTESLYRHLNDLADPELYETAWAGTKHLVRDYLSEAVACIEALAAYPGLATELKLERFERAAHTFGKSALMLSGGATLGFHHLGVVKALFEQDLLPDVLSGASMGAMIAAGVCSRTDQELTALFADPSDVALEGLRWLGLRDVVRRGSLLDPAQLYRTVLKNCGGWTFGEAHARSGRVLNISVSPVRRRQKPRVLCHLTSPEVLTASAALASSMVPGLFPPVQLRQRRAGGGTEPYHRDERWIDGSMRGDLPMMRVGRLHNVNHFIVSQTNPHVLPFVANAQQRGVLGFAAQLAVGTAHRQGVHAIQMVRQIGSRTPLAPALEVAHALADQAYRGDIDIFPPVRLLDYRKAIANPTRGDLARFIEVGERGTWPRIVMVRDQTRISRALSSVIERLRAM